MDTTNTSTSNYCQKCISKMSIKITLTTYHASTNNSGEEIKHVGKY
jgi:hypothetical protein